MGVLKTSRPVVNNILTLSSKFRPSQEFESFKVAAAGGRNRALEPHLFTSLGCEETIPPEPGVSDQGEQFDPAEYQNNDLRHQLACGNQIACEVQGIHCSTWASEEDDLLRKVCPSCMS